MKQIVDSANPNVMREWYGTPVLNLAARVAAIQRWLQDKVRSGDAWESIGAVRNVGDVIVSDDMLIDPTTYVIDPSCKWQFDPSNPTATRPAAASTAVSAYSIITNLEGQTGVKVYDTIATAVEKFLMANAFIY